MTPETKKDTSEDVSLPKEYGDILKAISNRIKEAQTRAMTAVNRELIGVYRDIGKDYS